MRVPCRTARLSKLLQVLVSKLRFIKCRQLRVAEKFNSIALVAKKGLPAPAVQPLGTVKLAKCALLLNLSDKELAIEHRASLADWTNRHIIGGFAMSTTSKLNPKRLAIKKKLHCRLGLARRSYLRPTQRFTDNDNQNVECSQPISTVPPSESSQNVSNDVVFIRPQYNLHVWDVLEDSNFASEHGALTHGRRSEDCRVALEKFPNNLNFRTTHARVHSTWHRHVAVLTAFFDWCASKNQTRVEDAQLPLSFEEGDEGEL